MTDLCYRSLGSTTGVTMAELKRRIGLGLLVFYGLGVMIGAGIYVLVGEVAAVAGVRAPLAFLFAGAVALPTALTYGELSARIPESGGEVSYLRATRAGPLWWLLLGAAIIAGGTVSAAAVLTGGSGYLADITGLDPTYGKIALGAFIILVAIVGVVESLWVAAVFTVIEILGLALVAYAGFLAPPSADWVAAEMPAYSGIGLAGLLAFFAFIGFEDIVNMAEETVDPAKTLPRAILVALVGTTLIYALVSWAAVRAVPLAELAGSKAPLAAVVSTSFAGMGPFLSAVAVVAALNGVLAQIVMAARVLMSLGRNWSPLRIFAAINPRFRTPMRASLLVGGIVVLAALSLPMATLAETTSILLLSIFCAMNAVLLVLKRRPAPKPVFEVSPFVPWAGLILSAALVIAAQIL